MINLKVCIGSACHIKGSYNIISAFQQLIEEFNVSDKVELKAVFCLGHCTQNGVSVKVDEDEVKSVTGLSARKFFETEVMPKIK